MNIDSQIGELWTKHWENHRETARNKNILLVEGESDQALLESFFKIKRRRFLTYLHIIPCGGRNNVLKKLSYFPNAFALVDRDTWQEDEIERHQKSHNEKLFVTEGWCIENLFLSSSLLKEHPTLNEMREEWVKYGAFWWVLQRTRDAYNQWQEQINWGDHYGGPPQYIDLRSLKTLEDGIDRIQINTIDKHHILDDYQHRLDDVLSWSEEDQWKTGVHGKKALKSIPHRPLMDLTGEFSRLPRPLDAIFDTLCLPMR